VSVRPRIKTTPPLAPSREGTGYLVWDDFGEFGQAYRETQPRQGHLQTVLADLWSGQYERPLSIVVTAEAWARDVIADMAHQVLTRAAELDHELAPAVRGFVEPPL
jgi:hypothetical protein